MNSVITQRCVIGLHAASLVSCVPLHTTPGYRQGSTASREHALPARGREGGQ